MRDRVWAISLLHDILYNGVAGRSACLADYVGRLVEQIGFAHGAATRGVTLTIRLARENLPESVLLSVGLIVNELVLNSLRHAFPEGRPGRVRVEGEAANGRLRLRVSDDGVGQAAARRGGTVEGSGLGLRIVRLLAGSLGGEVRESGEPGHVVEIELPLKEADRQET